MSKPYLKRVIDQYIDRKISSSGAILIEGAKQCGKTRTASEHSASAIFLQDPSKGRNLVKIANEDPLQILNGKVPRLIDEWQLAPIIWDAVRFEVDNRGEKGQFILTGSTTVPEDEIKHSGAGRIARIMMRPMSLFESLDSDGSVSLNKLFESDLKISGISEKSLKEIASLIVRGGWPESIGLSEKDAAENVRDYINTISNVEMSEIDGVKRDPHLVKELLGSLSRNISTSASISTIWRDITKNDKGPSDKTVYSYLAALERLFITEDLRAWNPALRSKTAATKTPKRHFVDPSIAAAMFHSTSDSIIGDLNTMGFLFESLCVRDLRVYSQPIGGEVYHYRDRNNLEADIVVHLPDGRWGAIEVKLSNNSVDYGAENLLNLKNKIDTDRMRSPSFLMVLVSSGSAYVRKDGVLVVPIGCLKD
jgi:predicted AAA+ superfamily ATPase